MSHRNEVATRTKSKEAWADPKKKGGYNKKTQNKGRENRESNPSLYAVRDSGVWLEVPAETHHDKPPPPMWICSKLEVSARTRDVHQTSHGRLLTFKDMDGCLHEWPMPLDFLAGDGLECRRELLSQGLLIATNRKLKEHLSSYILNAKPTSVVRCVDKTGWHQNVFVLPNETFGQSIERVLLQSHAQESQGLAVAGTLEAWRTSVATLCRGNSRLIFAVSTAFAASLLHLLGDESGGFNFTGRSSTGKTIALTVARSVWGGPDRLQRWRATTNGLEAIALLHNDTLLCLDELAQVDPREAGGIAYMLANGSGKARSLQNGTAKKKASWRLLFLSAGEIGLAEHMRSAGKRSRAGQEVRLADIPAEAGAGFGLFETLHGQSSASIFACTLDSAAKQYYGTPARAFLKTLVDNRDKSIDAIIQFRREFLSENVSPEADGQVHRVANRFALVAAAGEMATSMGITGWAKGEATQASQTCFNDWIAARGGLGSQEVDAALTQIRLFFELHGESRFSLKNSQDSHVTINRAGFRKKNDEGQTEFWVLPEVFKMEMCVGLNTIFVSNLLLKKGWIIPGKEGKPSSVHRLPGMGTRRCYHFCANWKEGEQA